MDAHIIFPAASLGILAAWGASSLGIVAGSVLLIADLHKRRLGAIVLAASALAATGTALITPWPVAPPAYSLSAAHLHPGALVTSPVVVTLCGRQPDGSPAAVPGGDRVIYVAVDGKQVMSATTPLLAVTATPGKHVLRVEILTKEHVAFSPPLLIDLPVTVTRSAAPDLATRC